MIQVGECKLCGRDRVALGTGGVCGDQTACYQYRDGVKAAQEVALKPEKRSAVDHPAHYGGGAGDPYEVIKIIDHYKLGFSLGNTVKYILRAGKKDPAKYVEDLEKAKWYLTHEIESAKALTTIPEDLKAAVRKAVLESKIPADTEDRLARVLEDIDPQDLDARLAAKELLKVVKAIFVEMHSK